MLVNRFSYLSVIHPQALPRGKATPLPSLLFKIIHSILKSCSTKERWYEKNHDSSTGTDWAVPSLVQ